MQALVREKEEAIRLRKRGLSYKDILVEVPVAKSTLSDWLKDLPLTSREKKYLKKCQTANISHGRMKAAAALHERKLNRQKLFLKEAQKEFEKWKETPLFPVGVSLYWAEGAKRSNTFAFTNSDEQMMSLFVKWIEKFGEIHRKELYFQLYIHKPYAHENCEKHWSSLLGVPLETFRKTVYKPTGRLVKKRLNYKGCLRVSVPKSSKLLYKMKVWQNMLAQQYDCDTECARSSAD